LTTDRNIARARVIAAAIYTMRDAQARCTDPLQAAARAFPWMPGFVLTQIHNLFMSLMCDEWLDEFIASQEMRDVTPKRTRRWFGRATQRSPQ
jgi:hypothetical protein